MPRYAKSKSRANKKRYYKKPYRSSSSYSVAKKPTFRAVRPYGVKPDPFPTRLHTRCKYIFSGILYSDNLAPRHAGTEQVFRLNSIYDPNLTGGGTTVVGYTTFASIYSSYIVKGAKVEVNFSNPELDGMVAFCSLNQTSALTANSDKANLCNSLVYSSDVNNTGSQVRRFNFYVKPWSLLGLSKLEWKANKSDHSASITTNPAKDILFRVATSSPTTPGKAIHVTLRIIYYVEFFNRKQLLTAGV